MKKTGLEDGKGRELYETKNDPGGSTDEPEVHEAVLAEVKKMGDNIKTVHSSMMEEHTKLVKLVEKSEGKMDSIAEGTFQRLSEAIMTKQEELEKHASKSVKDIEELTLAFQRMGRNGPGDRLNSEMEEKIAQDALQHKRNRLSFRGQLDENTEVVVVSKEEIENYKGYLPVFIKFLRIDEKNHVTLFSDAEKKLLTVGVEPDGGLLVPPTMSARIIERVRETDPIRDLATVETIGTDRLEIMEDLDEAEDGWETETKAVDPTDTPRWNKITIPVHWQSARPRATQQLLDDATMNMEQWLSRKVSAKLGRTEAAAFVTGTGIGRPRGFLTYDAWAAEGVFEFNKIEQVNMLAAAALTTNGFINVLYSLIEPYSDRAAWLMNRLTIRETMKLKDGDGQYIWRPGLQAGEPATLLALPTRRSTTMPTVAANALAVVLADFAAAYTIVDRMGITVQRDPYTAKPLVEFYTRRRVGGGMVNFQALKIGKIAA
jgi:HK97 family phage major capsid protein